VVLLLVSGDRVWLYQLGPKQWVLPEDGGSPVSEMSCLKIRTMGCPKIPLLYLNLSAFLYVRLHQSFAPATCLQVIIDLTICTNCSPEKCLCSESELTSWIRKATDMKTVNVFVQFYCSEPSLHVNWSADVRLLLGWHGLVSKWSTLRGAECN
jgi:hypothetical protein